MNAVLVDASFWVARRNARDPSHERALEIARELLAARVMLIFTPLIFAEVHAFFVRARQLREQVIRDCWENPAARVEDVSRADQLAALALLRKYRDKEFSFCDATSFVVIQRMKIERAVSFDHHFQQYGQFEVIG
jgi:uncharacterized protein